MGPEDQRSQRARRSTMPSKPNWVGSGRISLARLGHLSGPHRVTVFYFCFLYKSPLHQSSTNILYKGTERMLDGKIIFTDEVLPNMPPTLFMATFKCAYMCTTPNSWQIKRAGADSIWFQCCDTGAEPRDLLNTTVIMWPSSEIKCDHSMECGSDHFLYSDKW